MKPIIYLTAILALVIAAVAGLILVFTDTFVGLAIIFGGIIIMQFLLMRMKKEKWYKPNVPLWKLGR